MFWRPAVLGLLVAFVSASLLADEAATESSAELAALIRDLGSASFGTRENASSGLLKAGPAAIDLLARAAREGGPETTARSLEILNRLYASNQDASFDATEAALFELMKSDKTATRDRATRILELAADHRLQRSRRAGEDGGARQVQRSVGRVRAGRKSRQYTESPSEQYSDYASLDWRRRGAEAALKALSHSAVENLPNEARSRFG